MNAVVSKNEEEWARLKAQANEREAYYYAGDGARAMMPFTINVAVNNYCGMRCSMCDVGEATKIADSNPEGLFFNRRQTGNRSAYSLPFEAITRLIDDVAPYRPIIRANFLEPLNRNDITDIAAYTVSKGLNFYVITNGYKLPQRAADLVSAGTRAIRVSLDGPKEVHDRIRGVPGSFQKSLEGLRIVLEEKRRHASDYPLLGVCLTISNDNHNRLVEFYEQLAAEEIAQNVYVAINHLKYSTALEARGQNETYPDMFPLSASSLHGIDPGDIDTEVLWEQLKELDVRFPTHSYKRHINKPMTKAEIDVWYDGKTYVNPGAHCFVPWMIAQVYYNGDVGVNGRCVSPAFGNILENSFPNIWNSEAAQSFRRFVKKNMTMPACNRCNRSFATATSN